MKKRNKGLRAGLLIPVFTLVLMFSLTVVTFAYWVGGLGVTQAPDETGNIEVGVADDVETTVTVVPTLDNGVLVPVGKAVGSQVEELEFKFNVTWNKDLAEHATGALGTLVVNATANHTLLNVTTNYNTQITVGDTIEVTVKVTLTEPADQFEYDEVANNNFTLTVTFTVTPNQ